MDFAPVLLRASAAARRASPSYLARRCPPARCGRSPSPPSRSSGSNPRRWHSCKRRARVSAWQTRPLSEPEAKGTASLAAERRGAARQVSPRVWSGRGGYAVAIRPLHKPRLEGRGHAPRLPHFKLNQGKPNWFRDSHKADIPRVPPLHRKTAFILPHLHRADVSRMRSVPSRPR